VVSVGRTLVICYDSQTATHVPDFPYKLEEAYCVANFAEGVNADILRWARERAGFSLEDIADAFSKDVSAISEWEEGTTVPTYNQLEVLAYRYYKRPIALFFFPVPPEEIDAREEFRTLPDFEIARLEPDTRHAIREGLAMRQAILELTDGKNPASRQVSEDLALSPHQPLAEATRQLRDYLGISIQDQSEWSGKTAALHNWREIVQGVGVFVFKRSFKQHDVSGFSLASPQFPLIYISNSTAKSRQIFTLFHELAHILLHSSGITKTDTSYIDSLSGQNRSIEVFCNSFAGEFLVPSEDFNARFDLNQDPETAADQLSSFYNVSREVILRRLLDLGIVTQHYYEQMAALWADEFEEARGAESGGNYYATIAAYLGDQFMKLAFSKYYEGRLSVEQLAGYLNVKARNIDGLERQMLRRASAQ
jgi:Zn-dependent peptidase ImmA (M78 family)/transcriptional regulator with XRE-family HTH domain